MKFAELHLTPALLRAVADQGYTDATPIQAAAIPPVLEGRDVLGCAQTGTGKTAAFALPTLARLGASKKPGKGRRPIRSLVLSPTRELALQISENFQAYGRHTGLRAAVVFGGVGQGPQVRALRSGVDVLIATPGRLLDLKQQGFVDLRQVEVLTLDEADRMLDMGFLPDLRRIVQEIPKQRQTLLFSATMPDNLRKLVDQWLNDPVEVKVSPVSSTVAKINQSVMFVDQRYKARVLTHWLHKTAWKRALVFTRTKHGADKIAKLLVKAGIPADSFHSNKSQSARQRTLRQFQAPKPTVLVATDIAARGLDIDEISHVVNYDLPMDAESYVHRIGRTGRAGLDGVALSFCSAQERKTLHAIQRLTRQTLPVAKHPEGVDVGPPVAPVGPTRSAHPAKGKGGHGAANGKKRFGKPAYGGKHAFGKKRRAKPTA